MKKVSRQTKEALATARQKLQKGKVSKCETLTPTELDQAIVTAYQKLQDIDAQLNSARPSGKGKEIFTLADFLSQSKRLREQRQALQRDLRQLNKLKRKVKA